MEPCDGCGTRLSKMALQYHRAVCSSRSRSASENRQQPPAPSSSSSYVAAAAFATTLSLAQKQLREPPLQRNASPSRHLLQQSNAKHRHALRELKNELHYEPSTMHFEPTPRSAAALLKTEREQQQRQPTTNRKPEVHLSFEEDEEDDVTELTKARHEQQHQRSASMNHLTTTQYGQRNNSSRSGSGRSPSSYTTAESPSAQQRERSPDVPFVSAAMRSRVQQQQLQQHQQVQPIATSVALPTAAAGASEVSAIVDRVKMVQQSVEELSLDFAKMRTEYKQQSALPPPWAIEIKQLMLRLCQDVATLKEDQHHLMQQINQHQQQQIQFLHAGINNNNSNLSPAESEIHLLRKQVQAIHATQRDRSISAPATTTASGLSAHVSPVSVGQQQQQQQQQHRCQSGSHKPTTVAGSSTPVADSLLLMDSAEDLAFRGMSSAQRAMRSESVQRASIDRIVVPHSAAASVQPMLQQPQQQQHHHHHNYQQVVSSGMNSGAATPHNTSMSMASAVTTGRSSAQKRVMEF